jgi:uncharacterized protein GlcG (DUF336 family)
MVFQNTKSCDTKVALLMSSNLRPGRVSWCQALQLCAVTLLLCLPGCGGGSSATDGSGSSSAAPGSGGNDPPPFPEPPPGEAFLNQADVDMLVRTAVATANADSMAIAVVDRVGVTLAVWKGPNAPKMSTSNFGQMVPTEDLAVSLARTGAFFSNDQAPLSSRTVRFISGIHFPPGINNTPNADLYGIENTNRGCPLSSNYLAGQAIPLPTNVDGSPSRLGIVTGKADLSDRAGHDVEAIQDVNPGGVPIFKTDPSTGGIHDVGGIGIAGVPSDLAEFVAFAAAGMVAQKGPNQATDYIGFVVPPPGAVFMGGIALPFVNQTSPPADLMPSTGSFSSANYLVAPKSSTGPPPDGYLVGPNDGPSGGLTSGQVDSIVMNAVATASQTRAAIRLPLGSRTHMMISVADLDGTLIALYRMHDATIFSIDVAASKARNMIYFNSAARAASDLPAVPAGTAVTNRTISFGAQPFFPVGIDGSSPGPFFNLYVQDVANPCTQGADSPGPPGPNIAENQSGIVFFPGSEGLYANGKLVGGLGVSGDGVDQDDFVTHGGAVGFEAPANMRADQVVINGVRLPFQKFPRNPTD